jgi:hypothetical protein
MRERTSGCPFPSKDIMGSSMALLLTFVIITFYSRREYVHDLFLGIEVASAHLVFLDETLVLLSP